MARTRNTGRTPRREGWTDDGFGQGTVHRWNGLIELKTTYATMYFTPKGAREVVRLMARQTAFIELKASTPAGHA